MKNTVTRFVVHITFLLSLLQSFGELHAKAQDSGRLTQIAARRPAVHPPYRTVLATGPGQKWKMRNQKWEQLFKKPSKYKIVSNTSDNPYSFENDPYCQPMKAETNEVYWSIPVNPALGFAGCDGSREAWCNLPVSKGAPG
jgi:hypothetical protein